MRLVGTVLVTLVATAFALAVPGEPGEPAPVVIPGAEQFDVKSKTGLEYRIFVAAPKGPAPAGGYPVIYLSDGNSNFSTVHSAARRLSMGGDLPVVVVGIGYPSDEAKTHNERRSFDLTPPTSPEWLKALPKGGPGVGRTGGNDQFLAFIETELKSVIEKKYAIDRTRQTLFGHSFGGLFALHVLFSKPEAFQVYVAASPSIWWNGRSVLAEEKAFVGKYEGKEVKARLLVTVGEWEQKPGPKMTRERGEILKERQMGDNAKGLAERLHKAPVKRLTVTFREFAEEDHGSVVLPAASRGARFALESP